MVKRQVKDHVARTIEFSYPPQRIISIAPGLTDTLYALNLKDKIVGRTRYCIHPIEQVQQAKIVGGTKKINMDVIRSLQPDLIFAEKEENTKEIVEMLEKEFPVYVAEVQSVEDAYKMIHDLGEVTDRIPEAKQLITAIQTGFHSLPNLGGKRAAYVIWKKPYMVVGNYTYINSLLEKLGFINAFKEYEGRYPVIEEEDFQKAKLDYLILATEPFPFKEEHKEEFLKILPNVKSIILDGEMFWYGPRMLDAVNYFQAIFK
jgi:iron complex transport system substrate-binding protein